MEEEQLTLEEFPQSLSAKDAALLEHLMAFSTKYARRYACLLALTAMAASAMSVLLIFILMRAGITIFCVAPAMVACIFFWLLLLTRRLFQFHSKNRSVLRADLMSGNKVVTRGSLRKSRTSANGIAYVFGDSTLELAHPMMLQGYRLQSCIALEGAMVEIHSCRNSRALLAANYPDIAENSVEDIALSTDEVAVFSRAGMQIPEKRRVTHGIVTEVLQLNHLAPWPARSIACRNVRLKDDEFGEVNADHKPGDQATIIVYI